MDCLFCKISNGTIPAGIVYEDKDIIAFRDINPKAPTHVLIIPRKHIATINDITEQDQHLLGKLIIVAKKIAFEEGLTDAGYRLVYNVNSGGGQEVYHIHLHILGGRQMTWPPG